MAPDIVGSIVLFRFHTDWELCRERLQLIRSLNPALPVYGLYGGAANDFVAASRRLSPWLDGIWRMPPKTNRWKWLHQDCGVREWFIEYGCRLRFDRLVDYEYDLLLAGPVDELMPQVSERVVAFSGLKRLLDVRRAWYWTSVEPFAQGFEQFSWFMRERFGLMLQTYVSQGPFPVLPRAFLEATAAIDYPDAVFGGVNCEVSYPGVAEALGFAIRDTGLHPGWTAAIPSVSSSALFHCERSPLVRFAQIVSELKKPNGRRAFHPVKESISHISVLRTLDYVRTWGSSS